MRLTAFVVLVTALLVPVSVLLLFVSYVLNRYELLVAGLYVMSLTVDDDFTLGFHAAHPLPAVHGESDGQESILKPSPGEDDFRQSSAPGRFVSLSQEWLHLPILQ